MDDLWFTKFLTLVQEVDWLQKALLPEFCLLERHTGSVGQFHNWSVTNSRDSRLWDLNEFSRFLTLARCEVDRSIPR